MTLAIYYKDGKIDHTQCLPDGRDYSADVQAYNEKYAAEGMSSQVQVFDEDSIVTYLYRMKTRDKQQFKSQILELAAASSLASEMRWLEDEFD